MQIRPIKSADNPALAKNNYTKLTELGIIYLETIIIEI